MAAHFSISFLLPPRRLVPASELLSRIKHRHRRLVLNVGACCLPPTDDEFTSPLVRMAPTFLVGVKAARSLDDNSLLLLRSPSCTDGVFNRLRFTEFRFGQLT